ncbi:hypothetical protein P3X46_004627 [Hevea brasiliensis]|uniref:EF-hand domain-containing protein n=1 Tax=Hevea brasiliensis TaxID=3981 RepID=A0ABQ9MXC4_HEVBR|nr:probable calcium-binding protein CML36 [Hevea brasiliensis]KAJ9184942.1 hypothetical protein P3X46_004627 [Hevea brasiliensis]
MNQFIKVISPKRLFRSKKDRSIVSRSDPSSYSYGALSSTSSDSSISNDKQGSRGGVVDFGTPTTVLPEISGDWSDISSDIYSELVQAFKLIDRDNDGIISRTELEALLSRLGAEPPSQEELAMMLSEVDQDGDGYISVEALMNLIGSACEPAADEELRVAFEFFDTDQDGKITAEELLGVYKSIGDERCTLDDCRRMIAEVDKNGYGFVCFEDFSRMMELQR